ncbi:MAG: hypothetical protein FWF56_04110 [Firmicutes bacterium]|nr:hypothetical protein [Bacillota bacterium]MCL1953176.1 hypothetical protein [Bacillota bacterium]
MLRQKKTIVLCVLLIVTSVLLVACTTIFDQYKDYIAEYRPDLYLYKTEEYEIEVASGWREKDFALDGIVGNKVDFIIITVVPTNGIVDAMTLDYELSVDEQSFGGKMTQHPFRENFSAEIVSRTNSRPITLKLRSKDKEIGRYNMQVSITPNMIDASRALEVAVDKLKSQIKGMTINGKLNGEVYVLFVKNPVDDNGTLFWYVAFVNTSSDTYAVLIDPITEQVLAQHV